MIHDSEFSSHQCSSPCHLNPGSRTTPLTILAYLLRHVKRHEVEAPGMMPIFNSELLSSVTPYARPGKGRASFSGGDSHFK
jgi:hypothetical protein